MSWDEFKKKIILKSEIDVHPHTDIEMAHYFESHSFEGTEIDFLDLLYGIIRATKPSLVLETGTFHGLSSFTIAYALLENLKSFQTSKFFTIENDLDCYKQSYSLFTEESLDSFINLIYKNSIDFLLNYNSKELFDFVYFDSSRRTRIQEFNILHEKSLLKKGAYLVFHDTSKFRCNSKIEKDNIHNIYLNGLDTIQQICESRLDINLSRGLTIFKY